MGRREWTNWRTNIIYHDSLPNKKVIQIVAPTVWAWRKGRAKKFAKYYDEILTLFKFEKKYFEKYGLKKITYGYGSFSKGRDQNNFIFGNANILPLICYEIIFPELTQHSDKKTNIIVNIIAGIPESAQMTKNSPKPYESTMKPDELEINLEGKVPNKNKPAYWVAV